MPIITGWRLCVLLPPMVCSAWLLVVGVQVQGSRVCVQKEGCFSSYNPHPGRLVCCPAPDLQQPATKASRTIGGNNTYSLEPLMMGIEVPETC